MFPFLPLYIYIYVSTCLLLLRQRYTHIQPYTQKHHNTKAFPKSFHFYLLSVMGVFHPALVKVLISHLRLVLCLPGLQHLRGCNALVTAALCFRRVQGTVRPGQIHCLFLAMVRKCSTLNSFLNLSIVLASHLSVLHPNRFIRFLSVLLSSLHKFFFSPIISWLVLKYKQTRADTHPKHMHTLSQQ